MDSKKLKAIGLSYFRAALSAVAALYLAGVTDTKTLAYAFIAGLVGPAAKALDKSAKDFGLGSAATEVIKKAEAAVLDASKKALDAKPKKKPAPKKKSSGGGSSDSKAL